MRFVEDLPNKMQRVRKSVLRCAQNSKDARRGSRGAPSRPVRVQAISGCNQGSQIGQRGMDGARADGALTCDSVAGGLAHDVLDSLYNTDYWSCRSTRINSLVWQLKQVCRKHTRMRESGCCRAHGGRSWQKFDGLGTIDELVWRDRRDWSGRSAPYL